MTHQIPAGYNKNAMGEAMDAIIRKQEGYFTLGDMRDIFVALKEHGASYESIMYALDRAYPYGADTEVEKKYILDEGLPSSSSFQLLGVAPIKTKYIDEEEAYIWMDATEGISLFITDTRKTPLMTPTIRLDNIHMLPRPGYVHIKEYAENEGITQALVDIGLIQPPVNALDLDGRIINQCEFTPHGLASNARG